MELTVILSALTASLAWGAGDFAGGLASRCRAAARIVLASQACVAVVAQGGESGYLNNFWLEAPGTPSFLGISDASATGTEVVLGTYPAGTEIVLSIHVADTGHVFQSGAGYNNPDGLVHVQLTPGTGDVLYNVGFEDRLNGGDLDYNDALLDVVAVDCSVTAADDVAETEEDNAVDIAVLDNDSTANGELSITDVTAPGNGTVTELNGVLTYTPNAGFSGTDTFTYTVENEFGGSDTATVTVTVLAAPRVVLANNACLIAEVQQHGVVSYTNQFWLESPELSIPEDALPANAEEVLGKVRIRYEVIVRQSR